MDKDQKAKSSLDEAQWPGRFDEEVYDLLSDCARTRDMKRWFLFRRSNRNRKILLEGANLAGLDLRKADLRNAVLNNANLCQCNLEDATLMRANLDDARLDGSRLCKAELITASMCNTRMTSADLSGAKMRFATMNNADFHEAILEGANLDRTNLSGADLHGSCLIDAHFEHANLKGARLTEADLHGAQFAAAILDGETLIWDCNVDRQTDFTGVGLSSARIEPQLASRLETNVRRIWWENWDTRQQDKSRAAFSEFRKNPAKNLAQGAQVAMNFFKLRILRAFWWTTDYGSSTSRLLKSFGGACAFFTILYVLFPGMLDDPTLADTSTSFVLRITRALYLSIVTMTTVGFGDISANPASITGHMLLMAHVIIGYTLLGALVVRLGILFQGLPEKELRPPQQNSANDLMRQLGKLNTVPESADSKNDAPPPAPKEAVEKPAPSLMDMAAEEDKSETGGMSLMAMAAQEDSPTEGISLTDMAAAAEVNIAGGMSLMDMVAEDENQLEGMSLADLAEEEENEGSGGMSLMDMAAEEDDPEDTDK